MALTVSPRLWKVVRSRLLLHSVGAGAVEGGAPGPHLPHLRLPALLMLPMPVAEHVWARSPRRLLPRIGRRRWPITSVVTWLREPEAAHVEDGWRVEEPG